MYLIGIHLQTRDNYNTIHSFFLVLNTISLGIKMIAFVIIDYVGKSSERSKNLSNTNRKLKTVI